MKIGLDFDNTLIRYDALFYALAQQSYALPAEVAPNKTAIRDYFRAQDRESEWTEIQGRVYGVEIQQAKPAPGLLECLNSWQDQGIELVLVSHKTVHPYAGPTYNLHDAARAWIEHNLWPSLQRFPLFFEISRELKLNRIASEKPEVYIDDLPDILADLVNSVSQRWLYDPQENHPAYPQRFADWTQFLAYQQAQM